MIFSTKTAAEITKNDVAFLDAGIHENVALVNVRKDKSTNGNSYIEFEFNKDGYKLTHTEWEPTKYGDQSDDEFNEKINKQVARILQIMSVFFTKEQLSFEADSFDAFSSWVIALMGSADKTKLVRIKVVYGRTGYTSLPQYAKYTFIESMDITADKSKIKELSIDLFKRPDIGDKEAATQTAATVFGASPVTGATAAFVAGETTMPF
jgi:hypothetical protein